MPIPLKDFLIFRIPDSNPLHPHTISGECAILTTYGGLKVIRLRNDKIYVRSFNTQAMSIPQNTPEEAMSCFNTNNCRHIFLYSARPSIIAAGSFAKLISPKYNGEVEPVKVNYH